MKYNKLLLIILGAYIASSCTINDPIDDITNSGQFVPTVYWEMISTEVSAGDSARFNAKYTPTLNSSEISRFEVWYSLDQESNYSIVCPLFTRLKYTMNFDQNIKDVRPSQSIISYEHSEEYWDDKERAYVIKNKPFPTSFTLRTVNWGNQREFNQQEFDKYFPKDILYQFRDSLYDKMDVPEYRELLVIHNPRFTEDEFNLMVDTIYDENLGTVIRIKDQYTSLIKEKVYSIPVDSLTFDPDPEKGYFSTTYQRKFSAKACLKVIDKKGNTGVSEFKTITIN